MAGGEPFSLRFHVASHLRIVFLCTFYAKVMHLFSCAIQYLHPQKSAKKAINHPINAQNHRKVGLFWAFCVNLRCGGSCLS